MFTRIRSKMQDLDYDTELKIRQLALMHCHQGQRPFSRELQDEICAITAGKSHRWVSGLPNSARAEPQRPAVSQIA